MINLATNYLGITLKNPLIVGSSGLTAHIEKIVKAEDAGAGAVVLKSLFEEQIALEAADMLGEADYPEADDYILAYARNNNVSNYLNLIREACAKLSIPVIASINCISGADWIDFARKIEEAGAHALELNIHSVPVERIETGEQVEGRLVQIVKSVCAAIKIPVAVKISYNFSNVLSFADRLKAAGARGIVMFNRFYEPDIDIDNLSFRAAEVFSSPSELRHVLRWVGIVSSRVHQIDISASTGIHDSAALVKVLLAGAATGQMCTVLYKSGFSAISQALEGLEKWMKAHGYSNLDDFRGIMSYRNIPNPAIYERAQFMKYYSSME